MKGRSPAEAIAALVSLVPELPGEMCKVLAYWYWRRKRITELQGIEIGGFDSRDSLHAYGDISGRTTIGWAEKARMIRKQREQYEASARFRDILRQQLGMRNISYAYKLLRAEEVFRGTEVERLSFSRVLYLMRLPIGIRAKLAATGSLCIDGTVYTVDQLAGIKLGELAEIIKRCSSGTQPTATGGADTRQIKTSSNGGVYANRSTEGHTDHA